MNLLKIRKLLKKYYLFYCNKKNIEKDSLCPICLDSFNNVKSFRGTPCQHYFHPKCISKWLKKKSTCPCCRNNLNRNKQIQFDHQEYTLNTMNDSQTH